jgi:predicted acylesterase/phospholipase RssA
MERRMTQMASKKWSARRWLRIAAASILLPLVASGCATPKRLPAVPLVSTVHADPGLGNSHIRFMVARESEPFAEEARSSIQKEAAWLASSGHVGPLPPANFLAISGGGDNGAFGSGLLNGWTAAGTRPEFKGVTGVSTGALTAPFAFLGPKYDESLKAVFTSISKKDIFKSRGIRGIFSDGMADTTPLAKLIARYVDRPMLDAIAAEYAKGRLLLVGTADLDALEPVIWNMTAIAASKDPRALDLFRNVLRASASIPGAFPPVMFDVEVNGVRHQEMHGDGGTIAQVFLYPPSLNIAALSAAAGVERKRNLYIIRNAKFDPDWADVQRKTLSISARAIGSLTRTQGIGDLYIIYALAQRDGFDFNLTFIPPTFNVAHPEQFDTNYMQQLYAVGYRMAAEGVDWQKFPPGYVAPVSAKK